MTIRLKTLVSSVALAAAALIGTTAAHAADAKVLNIYEGTRELQELLQADFAMGIRGNPPIRCELPAYNRAEWEAEYLLVLGR